MRSSSSAETGRFCASSTISKVRRPARAIVLELLLDRVEQARLLDRAGVEPEPLGDEAEHVVALDLGRDQADRVQPRAVDRGHQMADQGRLAGADLAGDDDEALALGEAVAEIGHRLAVRAAVEPEARIGGQLEGLSGEAVTIGVHKTSPAGAPVRRCTGGRPSAEPLVDASVPSSLW